jgi:tetraacyldisaccharide 4'-kinase
VVSRDRIDGVALARSQRASVIVMDDGFQNPAIAKDTSLIVIDGERGIGNGRVFPAGPLRAPLKPQLALTDALIVVGNGVAGDAIAAEVSGRGAEVFSAQLVPDAASLAALAGKKVLAFAGIGDPGRFFRTLKASGIEVASAHAFADHHPFAHDEIHALLKEARRAPLTLVTTEKDAARLNRAGGMPPEAREIVQFKVTMEFSDAAKLRKFLSMRLLAAREKKFRAT